MLARPADLNQTVGVAHQLDLQTGVGQSAGCELVAATCVQIGDFVRRILAQPAKTQRGICVDAGGPLQNDDDSFERPDGSVTYNRWECRPWYTGDGGVGGMVLYSEHITERREAAEPLRRNPTEKIRV
mgnify:CR=1 FL=1